MCYISTLHARKSHSVALAPNLADNRGGGSLKKVSHDPHPNPKALVSAVRIRTTVTQAIYNTRPNDYELSELTEYLRMCADTLACVGAVLGILERSRSYDNIYDPLCDYRYNKSFQ